MYTIDLVPILKGASIPLLFGLCFLMGALPIKWFRYIEKKQIVKIGRISKLIKNLLGFLILFRQEYLFQ